MVGPGETGVVRRFGRVLPDRPGPGLHIGLPWGIDQVDRVAVELNRTVTVGYTARESGDGEVTPAGQLLTGDHNLVNLQVGLTYKVSPEGAVDFVVHGEGAVRALIERAAETTLAEWVAGRTIDDVLLRGKAELPRWVGEETQKRIEAYRLGVYVTQVNVTEVAPPAEVAAAFKEVTQAQTEIGRAVNKAEQEADSELRDARAQAFRLARLTDAYVEEQRVLAEAEAETFRARHRQYRAGDEKARAAYLSALWWDEMSRLYARMRQNGRIDLLDNHLGGKGLDITQIPPLPRKQ
jgi:membrane protease subunit HflK